MTNEWTSTTTEINGDAIDKIAELAATAAEAQEVEPGKIYLKPSLGGAHEVFDLSLYEAHLPGPRRKRGTAVLTDVASFVAYVKAQQTTGLTALYGTQLGAQIVAVLNDHAQYGDDAGWGDFTARLSLMHTPPWLHWMKRHDKLGTQTEFAEHIEEGLTEVVAPPAAEMLELAQHFEARNNVAFKTVNVLQDGSRQLVYEEELTAKGGRGGALTIPREFQLALRPYEGGEVYRATARLRYRVREGSLHIGYQLVRPEEILRDAFEDAVSAVQAALAQPVLRGTHGGAPGALTQRGR